MIMKDFVLMVCGLLVCASVFADSDGAVDFFKEVEVRENVKPESWKNGVSNGSQYQAEKFWMLKGFVMQESAYALREQDSAFLFSRKKTGIRQFRAKANLKLRGKLAINTYAEIGVTAFYDAFYDSIEKSQVSREEFDDLQSETRLNEAYVNTHPSPYVWIKLGRQLLGWGEADYSQILDLVNPRDERALGITDIEDARLPVWASKLSFAGKRWGTDFVLVHQHRSNLLAPDGSDFDPLILVRDILDVSSTREPDVDFTHPEILARVFFSFPQGDMSLIYAKVYDDRPALELVSADSTQAFRVFPEIKAFGLTANWVVEQWLFKTELAKKSDVAIADLTAVTDVTSTQTRLYRKKTLYQAMLGVEYSGIKDVQISLEGVREKITDYESSLMMPEFSDSIYARFTVKLWREIAEIDLLWGQFLQGDSDLYRLDFSYSLSDAWGFSAGYIDYRAENNQAILYPYRNADRIYSSLKYSF